MKAYVPHYSTEKDIFDLIDFYLLYPEKRYAMISKANIEFKCDFDLESSLLALLPHNILSSRAPHDFIFLKGLDSLNNDIKCVGKKSIDELKDICNNDPKCIGFNTLGFMKSKINLDNLQPSKYFFDNNDGLYIDLNKLAK